MKRLVTLAIASAVLLSISACGGSSTPAGTPSVPLVGTAWTANQVGGDAIDSTAPSPTAVFAADNTVSGSDSCNQYNGPYTLSGSSLTIGVVSATKMVCDPAANAIATAYQQVLPEVRTYSINGRTLQLFDSKNKVVIQYQAAS